MDPEGDLNHYQNLLTSSFYHFGHILKILSKSVHEFLSYLVHKQTNLVNFIVIGIFINKNTYIIPTNAYVTYRSVKDTDNVSRHFFFH